ncbi:MAG TPA: sigma-E factor negative regulatory protein [Ramlibacter sp.]|nr:sigma-E factor negative regulatory protein [Ramlibacter sp.]
MNKTKTQELVSALADGQLQGEDFARGVEAATLDPLGREAWLAYHVIGDVLRSGELAACTRPDAFLGKLRVSLQQEQPWSPPRTAVPVEAPAAPRIPAANDTSFRWKLVAGFASVAAVGAIAWSMAGGVPGKPEQAQLATANGTVLRASEGGLMIRDPQLDEFMAAHRQLGGASVLPAGFVRNATLESPAR